MSKTTDPFLDMLATPAKQKAARAAVDKYPAATRDIRKPQQAAGDAKTRPTAEEQGFTIGGFYNTKRAESPACEPSKPAAPRPSYADDIDRIVAQLAADGLVVFDQATDSYRRPNVRRWRFSE